MTLALWLVSCAVVACVVAFFVLKPRIQSAPQWRKTFGVTEKLRALDDVNAMRWHQTNWKPARGTQLDANGSRIHTEQRALGELWSKHLASLPNAVRPNARERERVVSILTARKRTG